MNQNFLTPKIALHLLETYRADPDNQKFVVFLQEIGIFYFGEKEVPKTLEILERLAAGEIVPETPQANIPTNLKELVLDYERWRELQEENAPSASREVQRAKFLAGLNRYLQNKPKTESLERWIEEKQTEKVSQALTNIGVPQQDAPTIGRQIVSTLQEQTKTGGVEPQKIKEVLTAIISEVGPGIPKNQINEVASEISQSGLFGPAERGAPAIENLPSPARPSSPPRPPSLLYPKGTSFAYLYYRPATWTTLFLNNFSVLFGKESRTNKVVLEQALEQFLQKNQKVSQNLSFVQTLRQQIMVGSLLKEHIERAYFDSEQNPETEKSLKKQGFSLLQLTFDTSSQKLEAAIPSIPPPSPSSAPSQISSAVSKQGTNILKNLVSKAAIAVRQLFVNPGLGWLRIPLAAVLGIGAVSMPIGLPLKVVMGSGAVSLGLAQARHSPGFFQTFFRPDMVARGAVATSRILVGLAGAGGASLGVPLALILGGTLLFLGFGAFFLSSSPQGIFLKEGVVGLEENYESEFIGLEKSVNPTSSDSTPATANFTITITAKKNKLTNIVVKDHFSVYSSKGNPSPPTITLPTLKDSLAVDETTIAQFSVDLGQEFQDSIVTNTVEVTSDVEDGPQGEKISRSASIQIGTTPSLCFAFTGSEWTGSKRNRAMQSIGHLSKATGFIGKLCGAGEIKLEHRTSGGCAIQEGKEVCWAGEVINQNTIILYNKSFTVSSPMEYVLAHESGHVFAWRNTNTFREFLRVINPPTYEGYVPTYPAHLGQSPSEDFAETIAVYAVWRVVPQLGAYPLSVIRDTYTRHWSFAKNNIFDGFEF